MQRGEGYRALIGVWTAFGIVGLIAPLLGGHLMSPGEFLMFFGPAAGYAFYRAHYTQRVLAAGYALEDIRLALREHALRQREELAFETAAEPPLLAKLIRKLTIASFGVACAAGLVLCVLPWDASSLRYVWVRGLWATFGVSSLVTLTGGLIGRALPGRRIVPKDPLKGLRIRLWGGPLGKWLTRIASLGMTRKALPAASGNRPTEIAIGLAADALFASLPKDTRRELKDLPAAIRRLEADAQGLRARVDELNALLAGAGEGSVGARSSSLRLDAGQTVGDAREKLHEDLTAERERAAKRLATCVAALENIRLDLLRLTAGVGTVDQISADLTAARQIGAEVDALLAGHREVEALLAPAPQRRD